MLQLMPPNSGKPGSAAAAGDRGSDSGCPNENGGDVNAQLHRNLAIYFLRGRIRIRTLHGSITAR